MQKEHMMINTVGEPVMLEFMAEKASDFAKAAIKLARIYRDEDQITSKREAILSLVKEYTKVVQYAEELEFITYRDTTQVYGDMSTNLIHLAKQASSLSDYALLLDLMEREENLPGSRMNTYYVVRGIYEDMVRMANSIGLVVNREQIEMSYKKFAEYMQKNRNFDTKNAKREPLKKETIRRTSNHKETPKDDEEKEAEPLFVKVYKYMM